MKFENYLASNVFLLWTAGLISDETFGDFLKVWDEIISECAEIEHEKEMAIALT